ncbi:hypothetical protein F2Q68_00031806 [Brassica cretica]|uniref:Dienelactone hydrolase domain-containing protein n=1 Tax=Brassica cretica TaxID=69181 RepID=A0A8S9G915_BRACR|nr:hypothetical protein F2Q68_00031806 [Brassica cretica]
MSDKGFEDTKPVLEAIKNKGITAIGAAGMCWGGKVVVELSKEELIQAAVLLHPTYVTVDDIKAKSTSAPLAPTVTEDKSRTTKGAKRTEITPHTMQLSNRYEALMDQDC